MSEKPLIQRLTEGMEAARNSADGQERPGYIILSCEAYEKLYYAAYETKEVLINIKTVL